MFAVRQWPGNGADLDFRGVLEGCTAAIVAAAPIEGTLLKDAIGDGGMTWPQKREAFFQSVEYAEAAKVLPFCRLWCVRAMGTATLLVRQATSAPNPPTHPPITLRPAILPDML